VVYFKGRITRNGLLDIVLKTVRELQDLRMEAMCLFDQLLSMQKCDQKDLLGFQKTTLSKYLLVRDEKPCRDLMNDLSWTRLDDNPLLRWPLVDWCEDFLQKALAKFWFPSKSPQDFDKFRELSTLLPSKVRMPLQAMCHEGVKIHPNRHRVSFKECSWE
jgi:hypothetical protein